MPKKTSQSYIPTVTACCIGYISEAVVNNFLPLLFLIFQSNLGISLERLALLVTVNFMTQLAVDLVSAKLIDRVGYRRSPCCRRCCQTRMRGLYALLCCTPQARD